MKSQHLIYNWVAAFVGLSLCSCDPFPDDAIYPSHCCSLVVVNDTGEDVRLHLNFGIGLQSIYTEGENTVTLGKGTELVLLDERPLAERHASFNGLWEDLPSDDLYVKVFSLPAETLIKEWQNGTVQDSFFVEDAWNRTEWDVQENGRTVHHRVWTFSLKEHL